MAYSNAKSDWLDRAWMHLESVGGDDFERKRSLFAASIRSNAWPKGGHVTHAWRKDGDLFRAQCGILDPGVPFNILKTHAWATRCTKCETSMWKARKLAGLGE